MKKIMVVDDEEDIRKSVSTILKMNGYKVVIAVNGDDCLKKLKEHPDLILMDIMMPGTPVKDIIKNIKDIKISFLSVVRTSEAEKQELMKQPNIVGFIQKPFDVDYLLKNVKDFVDKK